jgi:hypothetical protein
MTHAVGKYRRIEPIEERLEQGFGSRGIYIFLLGLIREDTVEHKSLVLVAFGAWREKAALHERLRGVGLRWVKGQNSIIEDLNDLFDVASC